MQGHLCVSLFQGFLCTWCKLYIVQCETLCSVAVYAVLKHFVLFTVHTAVHSLLCTMCYALYIQWILYSVPVRDYSCTSTIHYGLYSVHQLCTFHSALCTSYAQFTMRYALCNVHYSLCAMRYVLCTLCKCSAAARVTRCPHFPKFPTKNHGRQETAGAWRWGSSRLLPGTALMMKVECRFSCKLEDVWRHGNDANLSHFCPV